MSQNSSLYRFAEIAVMPGDPDEKSLKYNSSLDRFEGETRAFVRGSSWLFRFAPEVGVARGGAGSYDDKTVIARYLLSAFGDSLLNDGKSVQLFIHALELIPDEYELDSSSVIIDAGCGLGRSTYDLAIKYPESLIIGFDRSESMLSYASRLISGSEIEIDSLRSLGFGPYKLKKRKTLNNVFLAQADVSRLPVRKNSVNVLLNIYLLDRLSDRMRSFYKEAYRVLKPGGMFICLDPLNYLNSWEWPEKNFEDQMHLKDIVQNCNEHAAKVISCFFEEVKVTEGPDFIYRKDAAGNYSCFRTRCFVAAKKT